VVGTSIQPKASPRKVGLLLKHLYNTHRPGCECPPHVPAACFRIAPRDIPILKEAKAEYARLQ
jgi:hypothetical protein